MSSDEAPPRLRRLRPDELDAEQRALYEEIVSGPRGNGPFALTDDAGGLHGPFNAMLLRPTLGHALQGLGAAIRYRGALPARCREIAILVVAAVWDSAFERHAHEAAGRAAGLTDEELRALRDGDDDVFSGVFADERERVVAVTTRTLAERHDLTDEEYARAVDVLGADGVFELTAIVGYYATLALQLRVFRVPVPGESGR
ncbi:carboxymuconolactone decarboxylase [Actinomadura rubrobrunea]|uniref:Carboxymuconolactone decarboxylase n=1 Tax=Actinomadura rubrobrunea TaxID=115335 RepID=A0A9W6Q043_9ACTN|nr:carboxymuconolactone decarboxylase family protein [Actinomadura rubrobrunea]GLW66326.1 carboxymuconolactone decarboxylase [Actinomadura rubrobrunea]